ncbi:hypothetical protein BGZ70_003833 [Mortierella alpina]|uniref:Uncharacterized protein n=1 Tax=Mortierella alpina TaxID=64518 RepID=A0A9P6JEE4_MORAP|nr:hypothetical protein BGZ70_003833 [Mortierella alpina]
MSVLSGHSEGVENVTYSPSGQQIASGSVDKTVRIWDVESGECSSVLNGHTDSIFTVAYSSDGHRLASCSDDGTLKIWDVVSAGCLMTLNDVEAPIRCLAWRTTDAGSYLATGNFRSTVRMWRMTEDDGKPSFSLQWSSPHSSLNAKDANLQSARGLNRMQIQLLKQRGIVGEPIPPLSIRAAGEKLISMAGIVNRLNKMPKRELSDDLAEKPSAGDAEPEVALKGDEVPIEE